MFITKHLQYLASKALPDRFYCEDALITTHTHSFTKDTDFVRAYSVGLQFTGGRDPGNRWRINTAIWAAKQAMTVPGDFVECGVNYGQTSAAIMEALSWTDTAERTFWLVDSFHGLDPRLAKSDSASGHYSKYSKATSTGFYNTDFESTRNAFGRCFPRTQVVKGWVPDCLQESAPAKGVAFLHLDLNSPEAEVAAFQHYRARMPVGSIVLLDDFAYTGHENIHRVWSKFASEAGLNILALPTGQGLLLTSKMKEELRK